MQRCLPNAGSTETVTAGNGTRQHLTRRMSRNSWLQADVDVRELGGRQGPGKAPPLQALRVQAWGWGIYMTHSVLGAWAQVSVATHGAPKHNPCPAPPCPTRLGKWQEDGKKTWNRCQFLGSAHRPSAPHGKWEGRPPNTSHDQLPNGAADAPRG